MGKQTQTLKKRALVAEDSEESRRLIESYLKALDIEWLSAADGESVLELARANSFDLLLIDIGLPVLSGLEAVQKLRAQGYAGPIVSISANSNPVDLQKYEAAGFTDNLAKPFNRKQFLQKITELLAVDELDDDSDLNATWDPLAAKFAEKLPNRVKEIYEAFEAQDFARVGFLAHRVRAAGMFGFAGVSTVCADIDSAIKAGDSARLAELLEKLSQEVEQLSAARAP